MIGGCPLSKISDYLDSGDDDDEMQETRRTTMTAAGKVDGVLSVAWKG